MLGVFLVCYDCAIGLQNIVHISPYKVSEVRVSMAIARNGGF